MISPATCSATRLLGVVCLFGLALAAPVAAEDLDPFGRPDEPPLEPPLALPQSFNSLVRPPAEGQEPLNRINSLREVGRSIQACWKPPAGSGYSGQELTILIAFKRNGEVLGRPKITYYRPGSGGAEHRDAFSRSVREAFVRCSPLPFTEALGSAVAGRPFTFRFVDSQAL